MLTSEHGRTKGLRRTLDSVERTRMEVESEVMFDGKDPSDVICKDFAFQLEESKGELVKRSEAHRRGTWVYRTLRHIPHESASSVNVIEDTLLRLRLQTLEINYETSAKLRKSFTTISNIAFMKSPPVSADTYCHVPSTEWSISFDLILTSDASSVWRVLDYSESGFQTWWGHRLEVSAFENSVLVAQEWKDIKALCGGLVRLLELAARPELTGTTLSLRFKEISEKFIGLGCNFYKLMQYPEYFMSICQAFGYATTIVHVTLKCLERMYKSVNKARSSNANASDALMLYERQILAIDRLLDTAFQMSEDLLREASQFGVVVPKEDVVKKIGKSSKLLPQLAVDAESEQAEMRLAELNLHNKQDLENLGLQEILLSPNRLRPIGSGSSSAVYERCVPDSSISYAVKEPVAADRVTRDAIWNRVGREAQIWISLKHDNILPLRGFFILPDDTPALVMDIWPHNLKRFVQASSLTEKKKLELLRDVCSGLVYLHKQRIAHGDLRASNVLVKGTDQGLTAVLIDFGTAYFVDERSVPIRSAISFEATHGQVGNPSWLSPELLRKASSGLSEEPSREQDRICISLAGDVYSFGCLCLEVLFGRDPYQSYSDEHEKKAKKLGGALPATQDETSPSFYPFLCLLWSTEPSDRPSAEGVLKEINKFLGAYAPSHVT